MELNLLTKLKSFNPVTSELIFEVQFLAPELLNQIDQLLKASDKKIKINLKYQNIKNKEYFQQLAWYGSLKKILLAMEILPDAKNMEYFDEEMRKSIFPIRTLEFGTEMRPRVARMKELSFEELQKAIITLQERYQRAYPQLNFSNLSGE